MTKTAPRYDRNRRRCPCQVRLAWCTDTVGEATLTPHKVPNYGLVLFVLSTTKHHIFLLIKRMYRYWSAYAHVSESCTLRVVPHRRKNQRSCWQNWRYRQCLSPMNKLQSHLQVRYIGAGEGCTKLCGLVGVPCAGDIQVFAIDRINVNNSFSRRPVSSRCIVAREGLV